MENLGFQDAIEHDLKVIPTLRMESVSARSFYYPIRSLILKASFVFLLVNIALCIVLKCIGLNPATIHMGYILVAWVFAALLGFFISAPLSRLMLLSLFIKGRLKTESIIKRKYRHFLKKFFVIYAVIYLLVGAFINAGFSSDEYSFAVACFFLLFSQCFSFIFASGIATFMFNTELQRLGLGVIFNQMIDAFKTLKDRHMSHNHGSSGSPQ